MNNQQTLVDEAVDFEELKRLFARIPPGPYDALHRQDGWEVRQIDTDPGNKHHWPYRLCERIAGQTAECDDAVFPFIAAMLNAFPALLSEREKTKGAVEAWEWIDKYDLSLDRHSGDEPEDEDYWVVQRITGNINDREWDEIGRGETPLAAVLAAQAALSTLTQEKTNVG